MFLYLFYLLRFFLLLFLTKFNQDKLKIDSCGDKYGGWLWEKDLLLCSKENSFVAAPLNHGFEFLCQARFVYGESLRTGRGLRYQLWTEENIYSVLINSSCKNSASHGCNFFFPLSVIVMTEKCIH